LREVLSQTLSELNQDEQNQGACVWLDATGQDAAAVGAFLSEIMLNLLLESGIDVSDRLEVSLVHNLSSVQRQHIVSQMAIVIAMS
jgi:hypothetical protein